MVPGSFTPIRLVYLEDDASAFELAVALLEADGIHGTFIHVDSAEDYRDALAPKAPDLILADFNLPGIDGLTALAIKQELCRQVPFLFVSGSIGEEIAINSLRSGACDFILKDAMGRLPSAVRRALDESQEHRERLHAERRLRESEERFRRLSENAPDILFRYLLGENPRYDYISSAVERISGYTSADFYANPQMASTLVHPDDRGLLQALLAEPSAPADIQELRWIGKGGREIITEQRLVPVFDDQGKVCAIEGIVRDITEWKRERESRRKLEAQLFQAQKLETIGTLAGGIAHDFNNILTGILGYTELARLALPSTHPVLNDLDEVRKAGLRAKDLVAQILTFSRKKESKLRPLDLSTAVGEALKLLRASTPASIEIVHDLTPGIIRGDPTHLHQIVLNLGTNALHAMQGSKGRLSLSVTRCDFSTPQAAQIGDLNRGAYLCLEVQDTGRGMDQATLTRIFDPFFTTKASDEGTGLGLALVQTLVTGLGGAIQVASTPGQGTAFKVYFPACSGSDSAVPAHTHLEPGLGERIAVIDDESTISSFIAVRLGQLRYRVNVFNDPQAALEELRSGSAVFDALITDFSMPQLTGLELLHEIRKAGLGLPAILTTGNTNALPPSELASLGGIHLLLKPFTGDELAQLLQQVLSKART